MSDQEQSEARSNNPADLPPGAVFEPAGELISTDAYKFTIKTAEGNIIGELLLPIRYAGTAYAEYVTDLARKLNGQTDRSAFESALSNGLLEMRALLDQVVLPAESAGGTHRTRPAGRPRGEPSIPPITLPPNGVMLGLSDGASTLFLEATAAASHIDLEAQELNGWTHDELGRPEYRTERSKAAGSVMFIPPGQERVPSLPIPKEHLERLTGQWWEALAKGGPEHIQFFMFASNQFMNAGNPTEGFLVNYARYGEARELDAKRLNKKSREERARFNGIVQWCASLDIHAIVDRNQGTKKEKRHEIRGRMILAEAVGAVYQGPLEGLPGDAYVDISSWRIIPGTAWLASQKFGQIARYPNQLLKLDPHNQGFLIRLGAYLGHQTAVRASYGSLDQPLTVRALLAGVREPVPTDRRLLGKLKARLEGALDKLQEMGVLLSWQWVIEAGGASFLDNSIQFLYHEGSLDQHAEHHAKTKAALESESVQRLLPEGHPRRKASGPKGRVS